MKLWIDKELFQWERKRFVNISLENDEPEISVVQFYNGKNNSSLEISVQDNKAEIPDQLLADYLPIMAVACTGNSDERQVAGRREFKVIKRAKPEFYPETDVIKHVIYDGGEEV